MPRLGRRERHLKRDTIARNVAHMENIKREAELFSLPSPAHYTRALSTVHSNAHGAGVGGRVQGVTVVGVKVNRY